MSLPERTDFIIIGHGEIMTNDDVNEILTYTREVKEALVKLSEQNITNEEIIRQIKNISPRGHFRVFIHDDTIIKWYKFWK